MAIVYWMSALETALKLPEYKGKEHSWGDCSVECFYLSENEYGAVRVRFTPECQQLEHKTSYATKIKR